MHGLGLSSSLIASLNQGFLNRLDAQSQQSVSAWTNAEQGLPDFYAKNFHLQMNVDPLAGDYGFSLEDKGSLEAKTAAGYLAIKSGISYPRIGAKILNQMTQLGMPKSYKL